MTFDRFEAFMTGITTCYKCIQRIKAAEMTEFGLKGTHVMCLFYLQHHTDGLTAANLCRLCGEDKAAISRALAVLREQGHIVSEGRAYRALWFLTESGKAIADRVDELIAQWVGFGGDGLTDEERTVFYGVLERIAENLKDTVGE